MTGNNHGIVYNGVYTCEGHTLTFRINENDTVTVTDAFISGPSATSNSSIMNLDSAIELQEKYIKLGYDKVS